MNFHEAEKAALEILRVLQPACERAEPAGSVRRHKTRDIHDVEIVAIAKKHRPVFGEVNYTTDLHALTDALRASGKMLPRVDRHARTAWGQKFMRATWELYGGGSVALDLFITTREQWGWIMVLRTGPSEWNKMLVTPPPYGVRPANIESRDGVLYRDGHPVCVYEERSVFELWGIEYLSPEERSAAALSRRLARNDATLLEELDGDA